MLLRSASSPILKSWVKDSSSEALIMASISTSTALTATPRTPLPDPIQKTSRTSLEHNVKDIPKVKTKPLLDWIGHVFDKQENQLVEVFNLGLGIRKGADEECAVLVDDGGDSSNAGGGGGGGGGGGDDDDECSGSDNGFDRTDQYYQEMIKANPTNALLLQNYAKFLKEAKGDYEKAEEYCGRAILANANDGEVLSLYGELMWDVHRNAERAKCYFDRALQANPDDCYIMASYARCLWDAEEDEEEDEDFSKNRQLIFLEH